jgi:hypothetical protein
MIKYKKTKIITKDKSSFKEKDKIKKKHSTWPKNKNQSTIKGIIIIRTMFHQHKMMVLRKDQKETTEINNSHKYMLWLNLLTFLLITITPFQMIRIKTLTSKIKLL